MRFISICFISFILTISKTNANFAEHKGFDPDASSITIDEKFNPYDEKNFPTRKIGSKLQFKKIPNNFLIDRYKITLTLALNNEDLYGEFSRKNGFFKNDFGGKVLIHFQVLNNTDRMTLNSVGLSYISGIFKINENIVSSRLEYDSESEFIHLLGNFKRGDVGMLLLTYYSTLNHNNRGLFLIENNTESYIATNFKPHNARMVFPCQDEPSYRAKYTFEIIHSKDHKVVPCDEVKAIKQTNYVISRFVTSFHVPAYAIGFHVSSFKRIENSGPIKLGISSRHIHGNAPLWSIDILQRAYTYLKPKLNLQNIFSFYETFEVVFVPELDSGAVFTYRLAIIREDFGLFDKNTSTAKDERTVTRWLTKALTYQSFGVSLSPISWDEGWVTESVGELWAVRFLLYEKSDVEERLQRLIEFELFEPAIEADILDNHAIVFKHQTYHEYEQSFDAITINKAASMQYIYSFASNDRLDITYYSKLTNDKQFTSIDSNTLIHYIHKYFTVQLAGTFDPDSNITKTFINFVNKPGIVEIYPERTNPHLFYFSYSRYRLNPTYSNNSRYYVEDEKKLADGMVFFPNAEIRGYRLLDNRDIAHVQAKNPFQYHLTSLPIALYFLPSYFLSNYEKDEWDSLITEYVNDSSIIPQRNLKFLYLSATLMAARRKLSYEHLIGLYYAGRYDIDYWRDVFEKYLASYYDEKDYNDIMNFIDYLDKSYSNHTASKPEFTKDMVSRMDLTNNENSLKKPFMNVTRKALIQQHAAMLDRICSTEIPLSQCDFIKPEQRADVYCAYAAIGDAQFGKMIDWYKMEHMPHEVRNILGTFGCSTIGKSIMRHEQSIADIIRSRDIGTLFEEAFKHKGASRVGVDIAKSDEFMKMMNKYGKKTNLFNQIIKAVGYACRADPISFIEQPNSNFEFFRAYREQAEVLDHVGRWKSVLADEARDFISRVKA